MSKSAVPRDPAIFGRFRSWPITAVKSLEAPLKEMGLRVPADAIDGTSTDAPCLSDALVSVGAAGRGGTGSFVSSEGLIITNYHVAHDAVRQAALALGRDIVAEGYCAATRDAELRGPNYECWITRASVDVSAAVLEVVRCEPDPLARALAVRDRVQAIASAAEAEAKAKCDAAGGSGDGVRCDVQEMFPNDSYVLFTYERLRDVRIVYSPPKSLGNFGGDTDNFEWPRHTADFALLRAYVAPDGSAAEYALENVPYAPAAQLKVSETGAAEDDFVFLLGFPGSTMRYAPTSRLAYSDRVAVPSLVADFARKIALIAEHETASQEAFLKLAGAKKSLQNELKRSKGKLVMMRKLGLLAERCAEEDALCALAPEARPILARLAEIYASLEARHESSSALDALRGIYHGSALLAAGHAVHESGIEVAKPDGQRESAYRERNRPFIVKRLAKRLREIDGPFELASIAAAAKCAAAAGLAVLSEEDAASAVAESSLASLSDAQLDAALLSGLASDPFVRCAASVRARFVEDRDVTRAALSERDQLLARLLELQRAHSEEAFYPDANGSLRLSAGHVEGYAAADAVRHSPRTTLEGLRDKSLEALFSSDEATASQFVCPERLATLLDAQLNARETPVCLLYSTDTVGGNSGSPVLNAAGEFVGINFDRQRQGLMNEYKWSRAYSRSIGVDVRYILWLVGQYEQAPHLVNEMLRADQ